MVAVYFAISFNHKCREQTTMNDINLENLSVSELDNLKSNIDYALNNRRHSELIKTRQKIEELIEKSSFSLQEVLNVRPTRKTVEPKYRNPKNPERTWTGRGRRPAWVEESLASGLSLDDLAIKE